MKKREESKVDSYEQIIDVVEKPDEGVTVPPGIIEVKDDLKINVAGIRNKEAVMKNSTIGKTDAKDSIRDELIDDIVIVCGDLYAYANKINDVELEALSDISERELRSNKEIDITVKAKDVLEKATPLLSQLAGYGLTESVLTKFRADMEEFNNKSVEQGSGFGSKTAARTDMDSLFAKADKDVKVLDKLFKKFEPTYPEYYNRFIVAKNIKNKAVKHKEDNGEQNNGGSQQTSDGTPASNTTK